MGRLQPKTRVQNLIRCGIKPYWARIYGNSSKGILGKCGTAPFFLLRSFRPDRYTLHDFVPIKRFRWYKVYLLRRFVPRKRFKRYKRVFETCFVREKRFRWNGSRLQDRAQAVGDTFKSFIQKLARTCQVDADEAFSRFAVH